MMSPGIPLRRASMGVNGVGTSHAAEGTYMDGVCTTWAVPL